MQCICYLIVTTLKKKHYTPNSVPRFISFITNISIFKERKKILHVMGRLD